MQPESTPALILTTRTSPTAFPRRLRAIVRLAVAVCVATAPAPAQPPIDGAPQAALPASAALAARDHVEYDAPGDGSLWAVGSTYKAGFGVEGTVYAPFLGSDAARCYPVTFRIEHAAVGETPIAFDASVLPEREGDVVRYERGGLIELYELALESVEQKFVLASLPAAAKGGDLVLRLAAETDLVAREAENGFEFENELGSVRYGFATAFDDRGASIAAPTALTEHGIEIRVPADFLARARPPLTIDPVVSTFSIDTATRDSFYADVAYSATDDRWLVVYEEVFSVTDRDVRYRLLNASGGSIQTGYVESTLTAYWAHPAVGCVTNNFLVVAQAGLPSNGQRAIEGRVYTATTQSFGLSSFSISGAGAGFDMVNPDVGGRGGEGTLPYRFAVVWERRYSATDRDIHYRLVEVGSLPVGSTYLSVDASAGTVDTYPSISKSNTGAEWNVVWQRQDGNNQDLRGARIAATGTLAAPSFSIDGSLSDTQEPQASSSLAGTERWLLACQEFTNGNWDVSLRAIDGTSVISSYNLTQLETLAQASSNQTMHQLRPDVDSDGESFAVVYAEGTSETSNYDTYVSTIALTGNLISLSEGHRILAGAFTPEDYPAIAAQGAVGGGLRRYMAVWHDVNLPSAQADIEGGLYDGGLYTSFCHPNFGPIAPCPCLNPPSQSGQGCNNSSNTGGGKLSLFNLSSIGADTLNLFASGLKPNALSIFNQGDLVLGGGLPFGQGMRCIGGNIKRLYMTTSLSGGSASVPQSGDPNVHTRSAALGDPISAGTTRGYYVYYRDPVVLGGCPATNTFNTTQSVQAIWIP